MEILLSKLSLRQLPLIRGRFFFLACIIIIGFGALKSYVSWVLPVFLLGVAAISAAAYKKPVRPGRYYLVTAILLLILSFLVPVKTFLFFSIAFIIFYWIEAFYGSVGWLSLAALFLSSPVFEYAAAVFSFPVRLQLTNWVGQIFLLWQKNIKIRGNTIVLNGHEFSVDPACMGLHMLSISILLGIFMAGVLQRKSGKVLSWKSVIIYLACLFILNILSNLIRIVLLVQFTILPDSFLHGLTGLICLLLYVCLPAAFLARFFIKRASVPPAQKESVVKNGIILPVMLLVAFGFSAYRIQTVNTYRQFDDMNKRNIASFTSSLFAPGIVKLENKNAIVYVKFIRGFYDTEHNPTICWKGSGYEFREIKKESIGKQEIYTAALTGNHEVLFTAWWYGNGEHFTIDQWHWRWEMLTGAKNYALINVTAADRASLLKTVQQMIDKKTISSLFPD